MKLSEYAKKKGVTYVTAWKWFKRGYIKGRQLPSGTIIVEEDDASRCIIYARVSDARNAKALSRQANRLTEYATRKGYTIVETVKEVASGVQEGRGALLGVLQRDDYDILLVESEDRLVRFGFGYISALLKKQGKRVEVVNSSREDERDLVRDLLLVVHTSLAKLYGLRLAKREMRRASKGLLKSA